MPGMKPLWDRAIDDCAIALAWSPDGMHIAVASISGPVYVFDAQSGAVRAYPGHAMGATALSWHPDGQVLTSCGQDGKIHLWDVQAHQVRHTLTCDVAWVERVAWRPDGRYLSAAAGRHACVWGCNGDAPRLLWQSDAFPGTVADLQWECSSGHNARLAIGAYGKITLWSPKENAQSRHFVWQGTPLSLAWRPDGKFLAAGEQDRTVHLWHVDTGEDFRMSGYPFKVRALSWSGDSKFLATGGSDTVTVWDCSGKGPSGRRPKELRGHRSPIQALAFQQRGKYLASGCAEGVICAWNPYVSRDPMAIVNTTAGLSGLCWSPDGQVLAAADEAGMVALYALSR